MTADDSIVLEQKQVEIMVEGYPMTAYVSRPSGGKTYPGIVLGFELFGITSYIRDTADKIAAWGYVVITPDFYHRAAPGIVLEADDEGRKRGFELLNQLNREQALADVEAAMSYLKAEGCLITGMVGLSVGGHIAYLAAAELELKVAVVCYAGWLPTTAFPISRPTPTLELTSRIAARDTYLLFVVGEQDALIPEEQRVLIRETLQATHVRHDFIVYPGTPHGFLCDERPAYHPESAEDAWTRIKAVLARELVVS